MSRKKKQPSSMRLPPPTPRKGWNDDVSMATYYGEHTRFSVHMHIDYPGVWFVSSYSLSSSRIQIPGAKTLEEAKRLSVGVLRKVLSELLADLADADEAIKNG